MLGLRIRQAYLPCYLKAIVKLVLSCILELLTLRLVTILETLRLVTILKDAYITLLRIQLLLLVYKRIPLLIKAELGVVGMANEL